jgi:hypothetical protein
MRTARRWNVRVVEAHSFLCQAIKVWREHLTPVTRDVFAILVVCNEEDNIRAGKLLRSVRGKRPEQYKRRANERRCLCVHSILSLSGRKRFVHCDPFLASFLRG